MLLCGELPKGLSAGCEMAQVLVPTAEDVVSGSNQKFNEWTNFKLT